MADLRVAVIFESGKLRPVWVDRKGRRIDVKEVTYHWQSRFGEDLLLHYSCTDGSNVFELIFNPRTFQWTFAFAQS